MTRLNKFLANCGVASRRGADKLIEEGRVSVNGKIVTELGISVDEETDRVLVDGRKVKPVEKMTYIMFHKPKGCVTTASDEKGRKTIFDYLNLKVKLHPVGRLDYDSEGLLLLTNDGDLTYKLTHPSSEIPKIYMVKIEGEIQESDLAILRKGAVVDGERFGRAKVKLLEYDKDKNISRLEVAITEGKNREIRRMFVAVEKNVIFLKRVAVGELRLGGLGRGAYRYLTDAEVEYLKSL